MLTKQKQPSKQLSVTDKRLSPICVHAVHVNKLFFTKKKDKDKGRIQITYLHPNSSGQGMILDVAFPLLGYELIQGSSFQGLA